MIALITIWATRKQLCCDILMDASQSGRRAPEALKCRIQIAGAGCMSPEGSSVQALRPSLMHSTVARRAAQDLRIRQHGWEIEKTQGVTSENVAFGLFAQERKIIDGRG